MAKKNNGNAAIGVGVGMAAAAAAAGGAYWLYGAKHSAKHRKMAKSWMLKARAEVMDAVEALEDIDKEKYMQIAGDVVKNYTGKGASAEEIASMMKDFKAAWSHMQGPKKAVTKAKGKAKKAVKKAVKKAKKQVSKNRK
jgi:hypothetical protein